MLITLGAVGWMVRGSNPYKDEIVRKHLDRSWAPPSLLYNNRRVSFPGEGEEGGGKRPGHNVD